MTLLLRCPNASGDVVQVTLRSDHKNVAVLQLTAGKVLRVTVPLMRDPMVLTAHSTGVSACTRADSNEAQMPAFEPSEMSVEPDLSSAELLPLTFEDLEPPHTDDSDLGFDWCLRGGLLCRFAEDSLSETMAWPIGFHLDESGRSLLVSGMPLEALHF